MTKKEKEIYDYIKIKNVNPFDTSIFFYIGGAFPKAKIVDVINVVNLLQTEAIDTINSILKV